MANTKAADKKAAKPKAATDGGGEHMEAVNDGDAIVNVNVPVVHGRFGFFNDAGEAGKHLPNTNFSAVMEKAANHGSGGGGVAQTESNFKKQVGEEVKNGFKKTVAAILADVDKRIADANAKQGEEISDSTAKQVAELLPVALASFFANIEEIKGTEDAKAIGKTGLFKLPSGFLVII